MSQPDSSLASSTGLPPALPVATPWPRRWRRLRPTRRREADLRRSPATAAATAASARYRRSASPADDLPPLPIAGDLLDDAPAWLISAIVHMLLVIILGLSLVATEGVPNFVLSLSLQDDGGEDLQPGDLDMPIVLDEQPLESGDSTTPLEIATDARRPPSRPRPSPLARTGNDDRRPRHSNRPHRPHRRHEELAARAYGGTSSTETAVTEALRWLARNQA